MRKTTKPYTKRNEETKLRVKTKNTLLPFLIEAMTDKSRSTIKSYLAHRQVAINGRVTTLFDTPVNQGDEVSIRAIGESAPNPNHRVRIVFEDEDLIVVDKKPGVLSMSTGVEGEQTERICCPKYDCRLHCRRNSSGYAACESIRQSVQKQVSTLRNRHRAR